MKGGFHPNNVILLIRLSQNFVFTPIMIMMILSTNHSLKGDSMISQRVKFKCTKCKHTEIRTIGDVLPDLNMLKPCSYCGAMMERDSNQEIEENIVEKILNIFNK